MGEQRVGANVLARLGNQVGLAGIRVSDDVHRPLFPFHPPAGVIVSFRIP